MEKIERIELYKKQKETLETFLKTGAITKSQYDFSLNGLKTKMNISDEDINKSNT